MRNIVVISPNMTEKEYNSIQEFWRDSNYSQKTIRKALVEGKALKDGTRVRYKETNKYIILVFKNNQVKEFNSFNSVSKTLRIGVNTLKRRIEDGKEWKDYTFDILE